MTLSKTDSHLREILDGLKIFLQHNNFNVVSIPLETPNIYTPVALIHNKIQPVSVHVRK